MSKKTPLDKIKTVQKRFDKTYLFKKPWCDYLSGSGVEPPRLKVYLKVPLPQNLKLPKTYYGFDVIMEVTGKIRAF